MDYQKTKQEFISFYKGLTPRPAKSLFKRTASGEMDIAENTFTDKVKDDRRHFSKLEIEKMPSIKKKFEMQAAANNIYYEQKDSK